MNQINVFILNLVSLENKFIQSLREASFIHYNGVTIVMPNSNIYRPSKPGYTLFRFLISLSCQNGRNGRMHGR